MSLNCLTRFFCVATLWCVSMPWLFAQNYTMSIEISAEHAGMVGEVDLTGHTTYQFFIETVDPGDKVISVFGNTNNPTNIFAPAGYFNSIYASGPTAAGISLEGLAVYPSLYFDSYVTIGIENEPNLGSGETFISIEEDLSQQWASNLFFPSATSGESIIINSDNGGSWSVESDAANAVSGENQKVLIAQFTSADCLNGTLHALIEPADGSGTFVLSQQFNCTDCGPIGCSDSAACNYNPNAPSYPGSDTDCEYPDNGYDCDGNCLSDADGDGICDLFEISGCTDSAALNYDPSATDDNGFCAYVEDLNCADEAACNYQPFAGPAYCLQIESIAEHSGIVGTDDLTGYTTYRIYALCANSDDFISSISGDSDFPTRIMSTGDFYQSGFGGLTGDDQNPALFGFFPSAAFDSYVTIGLTESPTGSEGGINILDSPANPWGANFENGTDLLIDDEIGGSWFIFNGNSNGVAGDDFRVLLAQVTTNGELSGSMYVQFFTNGDPAAEFREWIDFEQACYGPEETAACVYPDELIDCNGDCVNDADGDGVCDELEIGGCDDLEACNYSSDATDNDGSCSYSAEGYDCDGNCLNDGDGDGVCDEFEVNGCVDSAACNYDMSATDDDGTCTYPVTGYDCNGDCLQDGDGDGVCDPFEIPGCMDSTACNYATEATDDDGSCTFAESGYDCDGVCLMDADGDGVCDEFEVSGCTDVAACNFDASSTEDNGTCDFCSCVTGGLPVNETYTMSVEVHAENIVPGHTTYRFYLNVLNNDDFLSSIYGNNDDVFELSTPNGFWNSPFGGVVATEINPAFFPFFPDLSADSWVTVGIDSQNVGDETAVSTVESTEQPWTGSFAAGPASGNNIVMDDFAGGAWYVLNGTPNGLPDENGRVLFLQLTSDAAPSGRINAQVFENGLGVNDLRFTYIFDGTGDFNPEGYNPVSPSNSCGCTDPSAFNYDEAAAYDDGSCIAVVDGCTDETACDYEPAANTDDGSCTYADAGYDCDGVCLSDIDGDGICDEFEVAGCTDPAAANYDPFATDDDASCLEPICIDPDACNYTEWAGNDYCLIVQPYQVHSDGDLDGYVTYRVYIKTQNSDDFVSSVSGDAEFPTRIMSSGSFFQSDFGGLLGSDQNPALFAFFPTAEYDSFVTIGLTEDAGEGEGDINVIESTSNPWGANFENGQDLLIDDAIGGGWFIFNGQSNGLAGDDEQVLLAQVTTDGILSGSLYVQVFINGEPNNENRVFLDLQDACVAPGGPEACEFPDAGYDCDGACLSDADGDGICDEFEIAGCDDAAACNYDASATDDDGSCTYADAGYDCDGVCFSDADGDGICDEFEVAGCTDAAACNYDASATDEDGSCTYAEAGYDCDGVCASDTDGDGVCDADEVAGCTVEYACNYNPIATDADNNTCFYATAVFDCDGNCQQDENANGICDQLEDACAAICGEGTIWDPVTGTCVALMDNCPYDLNGDGLVQLQDLMDFLLYYGTACPE